MKVYEVFSMKVYEVFSMKVYEVFSMKVYEVNLGAGVEQPFDCLIVQNRQAMQSMGRSMDWT